jgi:hypothetical protein
MDWEVIFVAAVIISVVGIMGIAACLEFSGSETGVTSPFAGEIDSNIPDQSDFYLPTVTGENISAYKSSCTELNLSNITSSSEPPYKQRFKFKGELFGIFENAENNTNVQLKIPNMTLYPHVIVSYSAKIDYNIGDQLEIYGEYGGFAEYENENVPSFKAAYIEKV